MSNIMYVKTQTARDLSLTDEDAFLYDSLSQKMKEHLLDCSDDDEVVNAFPITREVNTTLLAETIVHENLDLFDDGEDADTVLDDETHVVWMAAVDVAEWYENEND